MELTNIQWAEINSRGNGEKSISISGSGQIRLSGALGTEVLSKNKIDKDKHIYCKTGVAENGEGNEVVVIQFGLKKGRDSITATEISAKAITFSSASLRDQLNIPNEKKSKAKFEAEFDAKENRVLAVVSATETETMEEAATTQQ